MTACRLRVPATEVKLEFLQKLAMSDTDRVAEVLRQWITSNERIDNK